MKYKNKSRHKMLLQLSDSIKEVLSGEVFESAEALNYSFLEVVPEKRAKRPAVVNKPIKKNITKKAKFTPAIPIVKENLDGSDSTNTQ